MAIGLGLFAAPETALRALGFTQVTPATVAVSRVAGIRDLVLGAVTLAALEDPERLGRATLANAAADAGDIAAFALALQAGERDAGTKGVAAAVSATTAGIWTAWRLR